MGKERNAKVDHALRHLYAHDNAEGNSAHLDNAVSELNRNQGRVGIKNALTHIQKHDDSEGNSDRVDRAARILRSAMKGG